MKTETTEGSKPMTSREKSMQYFKTFFDACQAVLSSASLKDILDILVRRTVAALRVKAGALMLIDEATGRLELVSSHKLSRKYRGKGPLRADTSIPEVLDGSPVSIKDAFADPRIQYQEELREEGINTLLSVPVVVKEKVIGVLRLYAAARRDFSGNEMEFVSALAEIGGLAIANARIYEREDVKLAALLKNVGVELPRQPEERGGIFQPSGVAPVDPSLSLDFFRALHEVTRAILSTLDSAEVMDLIIEKVIAIMHVKACALRLINQTTRELELLASRGLSRRFLEKGPLHADKSIHETLQGAHVLIQDATTDPRIQYPEEMAEEGIVSLLSLPIVAGDRVIGILRLYTGETRSFDQDELAFLTAISVIAGIAIMNARLYEKTKYDLSFWGATLDYFKETGEQEG
jgi:signal transduction protein with GAF and PtsI domain